jgi:hypothetical protein
VTEAVKMRLRFLQSFKMSLTASQYACSVMVVGRTPAGGGGGGGGTPPVPGGGGGGGTTAGDGGGGGDGGGFGTGGAGTVTFCTQHAE